MTSFCIEKVEKAEESVFAELIDLVSIQNIHPNDGLKEIKFSEFLWAAGELDAGVLDQLV